MGDVIRTTARKDGEGGSDTCVKFVCGDKSIGPKDATSLPDIAQIVDILGSIWID